MASTAKFDKIEAFKNWGKKIVEVVEFETNQHTVEHGFVKHIACLSDCWYGDVLIEETGIEYIAERPRESDDKRNKQTFLDASNC